MGLAGCRHLVEAVDGALGRIDVVVEVIEVLEAGEAVDQLHQPHAVAFRHHHARPEAVIGARTAAAEHHQYGGVHALGRASVRRACPRARLASTTCLSMVCIGSTDGSMSARPGGGGAQPRAQRTVRAIGLAARVVDDAAEDDVLPVGRDLIGRRGVRAKQRHEGDALASEPGCRRSHCGLSLPRNGERWRVLQRRRGCAASCSGPGSGCPVGPRWGRTRASCSQSSMFPPSSDSVPNDCAIQGRGRSSVRILGMTRPGHAWCASDRRSASVPVRNFEDRGTMVPDAGWGVYRGASPPTSRSAESSQ